MSVFSSVRFCICSVTLHLLATTAVAQQASSGVEWKTNLSDAYRAAAEGQKQLVILFTSDSPELTVCRKLQAQGTLEHPALLRYADRAVFARVDAERDDSKGNVQQKMKELGVDTIPTIVILDLKPGELAERGRVNGRFDTPEWIIRFADQYDFHTPSAKSRLTPEQSLAWLKGFGLTPIDQTDRAHTYHFERTLVTLEWSADGSRVKFQAFEPVATKGLALDRIITAFKADGSTELLIEDERIVVSLELGVEAFAETTLIAAMRQILWGHRGLQVMLAPTAPGNR